MSIKNIHLKKLRHFYLTTLFLLLYIFSYSSAFAQKTPNRENIIDGSVLYLPVQKGMYGMNLTYQTSVTKKIYIGLSCNFAEGNSSSSFGKNTTKPLLSYENISLISEYRLISQDKFNLNAALSNGLSVVDLENGDNVTFMYFTINKYSSHYLHEQLGENILYTIQPGLVAEFSVFKFKYVCAKIGYNVMIGGTNFGNPNDFQTLSFSLGVRFH